MVQTQEFNKQLELYEPCAYIWNREPGRNYRKCHPQDEANRILAKITDGRLAVEFLRKETKSGSVMETRISSKYQMEWARK